MEPYDPTWLVNLVRRSMPHETELVAALEKCTSPVRVGTAYLTFVDAGASPNQPGSAWQFARNVVIEQSPHGMVVIDVLKDGRIGGIEFPDCVRS